MLFHGLIFKIVSDIMMMMMVKVLECSNINGHIAPITSKQIIQLICVFSMSLLKSGRTHELYKVIEAAG